MTLPERLSYSSISEFLDCGRRWKYARVDKIPVASTGSLVFGTAFHRTVQMVIAARTRGEVLEPGVVWSEQWRAASTEREMDWAGEMPETLEAVGYRMFGALAILEGIAKLEPLIGPDGPAIERYVEFTVPGVPVPIVGYIDLITADGVAGDLKTASRAWTQAQAQAEIQPLVYLAAMNAMYGAREMRFRHWVATKGKTPTWQVLETRRNIADLFWLYEMIRRVWAAIEAEHFLPNYKSCNLWGQPCPYLTRCWGER